MKINPDYYSLLGVARHATPEEIRRAYHSAARRLHPDVNVMSGETELFLTIQHAYEVLSDPKKRAEYDSTLPASQSQAPILNVSTYYSRSDLPAIDEPQLVYAYLEISPPHDADYFISAPLNVCLVVDRSTSMKGARMDTVKSTAIELVRQLRPDDIFSIVTFSDRAEVLVPASAKIARTEIEMIVQMIQTGGATEIYRGLEAGYSEVRNHFSSKHVNHIVMITDGRTYGDEGACMLVADQAGSEGIGISCLGIGDEWNDNFLDTLASRTGGSSFYISKAGDIRHLLKGKFHGLTKVYADGVRFNFRLGQGVSLRYAFRLSPEAGPLERSSPMNIGSIQKDSQMAFLLEFQTSDLQKELGQLILAEGQLILDIPSNPLPTSVTPIQLSRTVTEAHTPDTPPTRLVKALSRLTLYRMQEQAYEEIEAGNIELATKHLNNLATHLFSQGEKELARTVLDESENFQAGRSMSEENKKRIKYGTRALMLPPSII